MICCPGPRSLPNVPLMYDSRTYVLFCQGVLSVDFAINVESIIRETMEALGEECHPWDASICERVRNPAQASQARSFPRMHSSLQCVYRFRTTTVVLEDP